MRAALEYGGNSTSFTGDYASLTKGSEVDLIAEDSAHTHHVRLVRTHDAHGELEGGIAGKLFEGLIVQSTEANRDLMDSQVFGALFADGTALWVDSSPDSDYTDRHIRAALAYRGVL